MRALLALCLLIGVVAVAMPMLFTSYAPRFQAGNAVAENQSPDEAEAATDESPSSRQVEIRAERDGHFYVDAEINLRPVRLMVDTGATVVALRQSDAQAAGIRPRQADFNNPVQTANGTTMAAEAVLDSVVVQDLEVRNIRALIIPDEQLAISLLGGSFLNGLERFEVADGTLIFEN
jgi:aspartyl protease family protein